MREMTASEIARCSGGRMSTHCLFELGLNYVGTAAAIGLTVGTGGIGGIAAVTGSALAWSSWYRSCGPAANYGR